MMWGNVCFNAFLCVFYTQNTHTKLTIETGKNMDKIKALKKQQKKNNNYKLKNTNQANAVSHYKEFIAGKQYYK